MALVGICIPHGGRVEPEFYRHVLTMQGATPQHQFVYIDVDLMIIGKARNMLVETALPHNLDVAWFIDDDIIVPPDAGVLIDQALELGIVSGLYYSRRAPYTPQIYRCATEPLFQGMYWPILEHPQDTTFEVDAVGAGLLLVRTDIFEALTAYHTPRFQAAASLLAEGYPELQALVAHLSPWFEFLNRKGEDLYFCERAREAGYKIFCNPKVKAAHVGSLAITCAHFDYMMENNLIHLDGATT